MRRAAIYVRVSSAEQGEGYSLEGQQKACREYCDRQGYRVTRIFQDRLSGKDDARPAFQYLLHLANLGQFEVLVVWRRDRYFRHAIEAGFYERRLNDWGVRIEDVQRGPQDDSAVTRFTTTIIDAVAELERETISERCAMGRLMAARSGRWPTRPLFGYRRDDQGRLIIHWEEAAKVREAFKACIQGANRRYVGQLFGIHHTTASARLRNPAYRGMAQYGSVAVPCPAIVTPETWQEAQDALDRRHQGCDMYGRLIPSDPSPTSSHTSDTAA